jgi:surface antigen
VVLWGGRGASRRFLYSGSAALRLCRYWRCFAAVGAAASTLAVSGCSYQLSSMFSKDGSETTGSIARPAAPYEDAAVTAPAAADLAYARAAASDALARGGKDVSVPWQNPQTGAGGNITPLATAYSEGGLPCRDFLASYVHGGSQDWLQGAACRDPSGAWEVKRLKPLKG